MNLKDKYPEYETIPAYIINKDINNYTKTIVINVGEEDGVKPNMTVIADERTSRICTFYYSKYC